MNNIQKPVICSRLLLLILAPFTLLPGALGQENRDLWHFSLPGFSIVGVAMGSEGGVYIAANNGSAGFPGTNNSQLIALDAAGNKRWVVAYGELMAGAPVGRSDGGVYCTRATSQVTGRSYLAALDGSGAPLWELSDSSTFQPPVVLSDGDLLLVNEKTTYIVAADGSTRWTPDSTSVFVSPSVSCPPVLLGDSGVFVGGSAGVQLNAVRGTSVWRNVSLGGSPLGMVPVGTTSLYVATRAGLFAFEFDGSERWRIPSGNFCTGPVLAANGTIYLGTSTNALLAVDPAGKQVWSAPVDSRVTTTAIVGEDGGVFFGTQTGSFVALNEDGSPRWSFAAGSSVTTAPVMGDGVLVFGTTDGTVWGLRSDTILGATAWPKYQRDNLNQGRSDYLAPVPGMVTNLTSLVQSPGGTVVHLNWSSVSGAWSYDLLRGTVDDLAKAEPLATNVAGFCRFDDDMTRAGITYYYWVRAANPGGTGPFSVSVNGVQTNQLWAATLGDNALPPVISSNGNVFVNSWKGVNYYVTAFDQDGSLLWKYLRPGGLWMHSLSPSGHLILQSISSVCGLTSSGTIAWELGVPDTYMYSPAVDAYGTIYLIQRQMSPALAAVSSDGVLLWKHNLQGDADAHPVIGSDGTIYVGTSSALFAKGPDGNLRWMLNYGYPTRRWGIPAFNNAGELVTEMWLTRPFLLRVKPDSTVVSSNMIFGLTFDSEREPVVATRGNSFLIGDYTLLSFDSDGLPLWTNRFRTSRSPLGMVAALDSASNIYVPGDREFVVFHEDGSEIKRVELAASPEGGPVLTQDGRLYTVAKGRLYALQALAGLDTNAPWPMCRHDPFGTASAQKTVTAPPTPVLKSVTPFANRVRIQCELTVPASLELFRSTTTNFQDAVLVAQGRTGELFADDTSAVPGVSYYYWARLRNPGGTSAFVGPVRGVSIQVPVKWFSAITNLGASAPAVSPDGTIYTCATNCLVALNGDGSPRWQLAGYNGSPMVSPDAHLIIRSGTRVTSLTQAGTTNWVFDNVTAYSGLSPTIDRSGNVIVIRNDDAVVALSPSNSTLWTNRYPNYALGAPSIAWDGTILLRKSSTALLKLNPDGSEAAAVNLTNDLLHTWAPIVDYAGTIYLPVNYQNTLVATAPDGSTKWTVSSSRAITSSPVVGPNGIVFVSYFVATQPQPGPHLAEIAAVLPDGSVGWKFATRQSALPAFALSGNGVLFAAVGPFLYALASETGNVIWQMPSPNEQSFGPPVLDYDGTLYAPVVGGILALQTATGPAFAAWPMYRQNVRQSACLQRAVVPEIRLVGFETGSAALQVLAPGGALLLQSPNLCEWTRMGSQPSTNRALLWPVKTTQSRMFFRALSP